MERTPLIRQFLGSLLAAAIISTAVEAQTTRNVPQNFSTIQSAIAASQNGDTVQVAPGTYVENINFLGKAITVVSVAGPDLTTIDGGQVSSVVTFNTGEGLFSVLDGFTIRNGKGTSNAGGGIRILSASPTIRRNHIINNFACDGAGILVNFSSALIQGNVINNNNNNPLPCSGSPGGGGILISGAASAQILDNTISNNTTLMSGGGLSLFGAGTPTIRGNIITGNSTINGGGISMQNTSDAKIIQNVIAGNTATQIGGGSGGGIYVLVGSGAHGPWITNNTIVDNDGGQIGSAIAVDGFDSLVPIKNNILIGKDGQPAVYCGNQNNQHFQPIFGSNDVYSSGSPAYTEFCNDPTGTNGNISASLSFADRAAQNFRLLPGSPGIDAGDNTVPDLIATDLDSFPRILPVAGTVDMGPYEFGAPTTSTVSATDLTFADQPAGTVSAPSDITLTNTGATPLLVSKVTISGEFSQTNTCQTPAGIPAGQSCTISVRFAPTTGGVRSGQLTINSNTPVNVVNLSGNGVGVLAMSKEPISFGAQRVGTLSSPVTVVVTNTGSVNLDLTSIATTGDFTGTHDCPVSMAANTSCSITVRFAPVARGARFGAVTVNALGSLHIVPLSGIGLAPTISFSPSSLQFNSQLIGTTSAPQGVTVSNQGDLALSITSVGSTGDYGSTNNCGSSLAVNATCTINVVFSPTMTGTRNGTITVFDDAIGSPQAIALSGTATFATLTATPTSLVFSDQPVNTTSTVKTVTLRNTGNGTMAISNIVASTDFSKTSSCFTLTPNGTCTVSVTFRPSGAGLETGTLTITDNATGSPHTVPLSGTGIETILYSATSLTFAADLVGTTSPPQVVTVTNAKTVPLTFSGITASGNYSYTTTCGTTLPVAGSCTVSVFFSPTASGTRSGSLTIAIDGVGPDQVISLTGTGLDTLAVPVITTISPNSRAVGATGTTLTVSGSGFSSLSVLRWGGVDRPTILVNNNNLTATLSASDFVTMATIPVAVFNPAPGGGLSNSVEFSVYFSKTLTTKDLIYDRSSNRIYASVAAAAPSLANTLSAIEPITGNLGTSVSIGSDPGKLAISDDSHTIYVALDGSAQVRPFDTVSQSPGTAFLLGSDPNKGAKFAEDIAVVPGNPQAIAVARKYANLSPRAAGVAIYDNGVKRNVETPDHIGSNVIEFSGTSSILYGYDMESSPAGFRTMSVDNSGVVITNVASNLIPPGSTDFKYEGGRVYSFAGQIIDPVSGTQIGIFTLPTGGQVRGLVADSALQRAFILYASTTSVRILAFNLNTFAAAGSVTLPAQGTVTNIGSLIRWGDNGLAFRSGTQVFTLQIPPSWLPILPYTLTINRTGAGSGRVTSVPAGIDCGATCSAVFTSPQTVSLTATPLSGSIFAGWSGDSDCTDGFLTMSNARNCTARFTLPPVATGDSYIVDKGGTLNVAAPGVLGNDTDADGNQMTAVQLTPAIHGTVTLNPDGSFSYVHNGSDVVSDSFTYKINDGLADSNIATVALSIDGLFVYQFQPTSTGFTAQFSRPIDATVLNLYTTETGGFGQPDVALVGTAGGAVNGSIVVSANGGSITFIRTGGILPPDTYTATLRSATNGFKSSTVGLLDGNHDGTAGDNFSTTFTVVGSPAVIVSVPDFSRGPGQAVNLSGTGIPVVLSDGTGVSQVDLVLRYDPALLQISQVTAGAGLPFGTVVQADFSIPDRMHVTVTSAAPLDAGSTELLRVAAQVPFNTPYRASQILAISNLILNGGAIPAIADDGIHVAAYIGDTTGNGSYSSLDAQRILRVSSGLDSGFAAFPTIDPVIVGDITGNGVLSSLDATRLLQETVGIDRPEIPPIP